MVRDINGYNGFGLSISDTKYSAILTVSTDTSLAVPEGSTMGSGHSTNIIKYLAIFSYSPGASVWVSVNATAAVAAGASFAVTTSELLPTARYVSYGDTLHFISPAASAEVGVAFYALL
jgi:hypothetical protein